MLLILIVCIVLSAICVVISWQMFFACYITERQKTLAKFQSAMDDLDVQQASEGKKTDTYI